MMRKIKLEWFWGYKFINSNNSFLLIVEGWKWSKLEKFKGTHMCALQKKGTKTHVAYIAINYNLHKYLFIYIY